MTAKNRLSAIIAEDEGRSAAALNNMLAEYCPEVEVKQITGTISETQEMILKLRPDILFLDIEMPDGNSFELLKKQGRHATTVIFTTAYDHYAFRAIKSDATDYLLKPIQPEELVAAVAKASKLIADSGLQEHLVSLMQHGYSQSPIKLAIPSGGGILFMEADTVLCCTASGSYTVIYTETAQKIISSKNIKEIESLLPGYFFRVHHSHIINLHHIMRYVHGRGGYVVMKDGTEIEVSARRKEQFLKIFRH